MAEISFFPKYEQKENKVTNYTLLILKQVYNESPYLFQELISNLLGDDEKINVGVNFSQQKGFKSEQGKSIIDGVIEQKSFTIFIETKNFDWFYEDQLERHIGNLSKNPGKKILLALSNFEGQEEQKLFKEIEEKYNNDSKDITLKSLEFEDLNEALKGISDKIKSDVLSIMLKEYEQFLNGNDLLPTWKYRLDVVNCKQSKNDVLSRSLYICPDTKGAYKHVKSKYFGIYENKKVDTIAEIKAVCVLNEYDKDKKPIIDISWFDKEKYDNKESVLKEAEEKAKKYEIGSSTQMFLLDNFRHGINFIKKSSGGLFGSKIYFNIQSVKNIDELVEKIKNKNWSDFQ